MLSPDPHATPTGSSQRSHSMSDAAPLADLINNWSSASAVTLPQSAESASPATDHMANTGAAAAQMSPQFQAEFYNQLCLQVAARQQQQQQQPQAHQAPRPQTLPSSGDTSSSSSSSTSSSANDDNQREMLGRQYFSFFQSLQAQAARSNSSPSSTSVSSSCGVSQLSVAKHDLTTTTPAPSSSASASVSTTAPLSGRKRPLRATTSTRSALPRTAASKKQKMPPHPSSSSLSLSGSDARCHSQSPCRGSESDSDSIEPKSSAEEEEDGEGDGMSSQPRAKRRRTSSLSTRAALGESTHAAALGESKGARRSLRSHVHEQKVARKCEAVEEASSSTPNPSASPRPNPSASSTDAASAAGDDGRSAHEGNSQTFRCSTERWHLEIPTFPRVVTKRSSARKASIFLKRDSHFEVYAYPRDADASASPSPSTATATAATRQQRCPLVEVSLERQRPCSGSGNMHIRDSHFEVYAYPRDASASPSPSPSTATATAATRQQRCPLVEVSLERERRRGAGSGNMPKYALRDMTTGRRGPNQCFVYKADLNKLGVPRKAWNLCHGSSARSTRNSFEMHLHVDGELAPRALSFQVCPFPRRRKDAVTPSSSSAPTPSSVATAAATPLQSTSSSRTYKYRTRRQTALEEAPTQEREVASSASRTRACAAPSPRTKGAPADQTSVDLRSRNNDHLSGTLASSSQSVEARTASASPTYAKKRRLAEGDVLDEAAEEDDNEKKCPLEDARLARLEAELLRAREERERDFQRFQAQCDYERRLVDKLKDAKAKALRKTTETERRKRKRSGSVSSTTEEQEVGAQSDKTRPTSPAVAMATRPSPPKRHRTSSSRGAESNSRGGDGPSCSSPPVAVATNSVRVRAPRAVSAPVVFSADDASAPVVFSADAASAPVVFSADATAASPPTDSDRDSGLLFRANAKASPTVTFSTTGGSHSQAPSQEETIQTYHKLIVQHINASKRAKSESSASCSLVPKVEDGALTITQTSTPATDRRTPPATPSTTHGASGTTAVKQTSRSVSPKVEAAASSLSHPRPRLLASIYPPHSLMNKIPDPTLESNNKPLTSVAELCAPRPKSDAEMRSRLWAAHASDKLAAATPIKKELESKVKSEPISPVQSQESQINAPVSSATLLSALASGTPPGRLHQLDMETFYMRAACAASDPSRPGLAVAARSTTPTIQVPFPLRHGGGSPLMPTASSISASSASSGGAGSPVLGAAKKGPRARGKSGGRPPAPRAVKTCQTCFVAKTKCSGDRPCYRCQRLGRECFDRTVSNLRTVRACKRCHERKAGCDNKRPCTMCVRAKQAHLCVDRVNAKRGPRGVKSPPTVKRQKLTHTKSEPHLGSGSGSGSGDGAASPFVASAAAASAARGCTSAGNSPILPPATVGGVNPLTGRSLPVASFIVGGVGGGGTMPAAMMSPSPSSPVSGAALASLGMPPSEAHQVGDILKKIRTEQQQQLMGSAPSSPLMGSPLPTPTMPTLQHSPSLPNSAHVGPISGVRRPSDQWSSMMRLMQQGGVVPSADGQSGSGAAWMSQATNMPRQKQQEANPPNDVVKARGAAFAAMMQRETENSQNGALSQVLSYPAFVKQMHSFLMQQKLQHGLGSPPPKHSVVGPLSPLPPTASVKDTSGGGDRKRLAAQTPTSAAVAAVDPSVSRPSSPPTAAVDQKGLASRPASPPSSPRRKPAVQQPPLDKIKPPPQPPAAVTDSASPSPAKGSDFAAAALLSLAKSGK